MGTEVMRPQDLLVDRFRVQPASFHRRRKFSGHGNLKDLVVQPKQNNNKGNKKTSPKDDGKKRSNTAKAEISKTPRDGGVADSRWINKISLVMGQVTLLRRGESLGSLAAKIKDGNHQNEKSQNQVPTDDVAAVQGGDRMVSESPKVVPKKIRLAGTHMYAGSAFVLSPSPRAVPLPSFFLLQHQEAGKQWRNSVT